MSSKIIDFFKDIPTLYAESEGAIGLQQAGPEILAD